MSGETVTLAGAGADADAGDALAYAWRQSAGPAVTLENASSAVATFTAPAVRGPTGLAFTLRVSDAGGLSHEDTVAVTVRPALTAELRGAPRNHDGARAFHVEVRFSEPVTLSWRAFRDGLLAIDGGTLVGQRRLVAGDSRRWQVDIRPGGAGGDVTVTLPAGGACDPDAAPCTPDGRPLAADARIEVFAPGVAGRLALAVDPVTGDDTVNRAERAAGVEVAGTGDGGGRCARCGGGRRGDGDAWGRARR